MNIVQVAKQIKDEEARNMLSHPEDYPIDMIDWAKRRLNVRD